MSIIYKQTLAERVKELEKLAEIGKDCECAKIKNMLFAHYFRYVGNKSTLDIDSEMTVRELIVNICAWYDERLTEKYNEVTALKEGGAKI